MLGLTFWSTCHTLAFLPKLSCHVYFTMHVTFLPSALKVMPRISSLDSYVMSGQVYWFSTLTLWTLHLYYTHHIKSQLLCPNSQAFLPLPYMSWHYLLCHFTFSMSLLLYPKPYVSSTQPSTSTALPQLLHLMLSASHIMSQLLYTICHFLWHIQNAISHLVSFVPHAMSYHIMSFDSSYMSYMLSLVSLPCVSHPVSSPLPHISCHDTSALHVTWCFIFSALHVTCHLVSSSWPGITHLICSMWHVISLLSCMPHLVFSSLSLLLCPSHLIFSVQHVILGLLSSALYTLY